MKDAFRRVLAAETVSNFGSMLSRLAIPWIAALLLDATPFGMAALVVADVVAGAAGALFLGVIVDRYGKRAVMLFSDIGRAVLIAVVAWLAYVGRLPFWALVIAAGAGGILTMLFELARSAWMAQQLAADDLDQRNSQVATATAISETAAFAMAGWLYQAAGAALALAIDAATYVVSALCLRRVPDAPKVVESRAPGLSVAVHEIRAGVRAIADVPMLRTLAVLETLVAFGLAMAGTTYMIFVSRDLAFETGWLGMIIAMGGIGSLAGAALASRAKKALGREGAMLAGLCTFACGTLFVPLAPGATALGAALLIAHQVVGDGGHVLFDIQDRTLRQTLAAPEMLARVDAAIRTLGHSARLAGAVVGGAVGTSLGTRETLFLATATFAAAALYFYVRAFLSEST